MGLTFPVEIMMRSSPERPSIDMVSLARDCTDPETWILSLPYSDKLNPSSLMVSWVDAVLIPKFAEFAAALNLIS